MKKIIVDTDLGGDCDDVGALAVACNLAKCGCAELLGVTYCIGNPWGGYFTRSELDWFGFEKVPVGVLKDEQFMAGEKYEKYSKPYCLENNVQTAENEEATRLLRRLLVENHDVTLIAIGPLRNISKLLDSTADDISPLSGRELVKKSCVEFVTMLGCFSRPEHVEWNVEMDIDSARNVIKKMPVKTVFSPFELGDHIFTGHNNQSLPENHPVRAAYYLHSSQKSYLRQSWDPITVYAAVTESPLWKMRETSVFIDETGHCVEQNIGQGSVPMFVLEQVASDEEIAETLDELMK